LLFQFRLVVVSNLHRRHQTQFSRSFPCYGAIALIIVNQTTKIPEGMIPLVSEFHSGGMHHHQHYFRI
jgi:hypothetical protein